MATDRAERDALLHEWPTFGVMMYVLSVVHDNDTSSESSAALTSAVASILSLKHNAVSQSHRSTDGTASGSVGAHRYFVCSKSACYFVGGYFTPPRTLDSKSSFSLLLLLLLLLFLQDTSAGDTLASRVS